MELMIVRIAMHTEKVDSRNHITFLNIAKYYRALALSKSKLQKLHFGNKRVQKLW
jgi:hypothetical protein